MVRAVSLHVDWVGAGSAEVATIGPDEEINGQTLDEGNLGIVIGYGGSTAVVVEGNLAELLSWLGKVAAAVGRAVPA